MILPFMRRTPIWAPRYRSCLFLALVAVFNHFIAAGVGADETANRFRDEVQPILKEFCYDCHGDGAKKGGVVLDEFGSPDELVKPDLWLKVLKNTRAGLMPPHGKPHPQDADLSRLEKWVKYSAFAIDPENPDPGRVTLRRLNRVEYRNTIHDLMGIDFHAEAEFPPDDTGYGFDTIGDVLTVSPMLLEKYLAAAQSIVSEAVPTVSMSIPELVVPGGRFHRPNAGAGREDGKSVSLSFYEVGTVETHTKLEIGGTYQVAFDLSINGGFDFDPGRCRVTIIINDREWLRKEFGWYDFKTFHFEFAPVLDSGDQVLSVEVEPLVPVEKKLHSLDLRVAEVRFQGPADRDHWVHPKNYERFFPHEPPTGLAERRAYASQLLEAFATRAFRRPADKQSVDRLTSMAEAIYQQPGKTFEKGVAHAMVAVLASPRFLFRFEEQEEQSTQQGPFKPIDELSLASRLSYFLWSTMPDDELIQLAHRGELRKNLGSQVKRMLADSRSDNFIQNFTGQWLQTRDVEGTASNARVILARDDGLERELREEREAFQAFLAQRAKATAKTNSVASSSTNGIAGTTNTASPRPTFPKRRFAEPRMELDRELRLAMRRETELFFGSILHEDRPVTDLIESDFTFLNERLAKLYGLTNLNITGSNLQRVQLPPDSPRGGVLTQGSALLVTSNPDRTSPVKRGLFILDNILGTPAPPPPPNVPALEAVDKDFKDHEPTLREALAVHREKPLCASCHNRMDPLGLAFENFNAMGMWREKERNQSIETGGQLITGESFHNVRELKHLLANEHRRDFYRCLTEKLLTYAVGRGPEFYDIETTDRIVNRLEYENGRFSALMLGIVESAPFQKMRIQSRGSASNTPEAFDIQHPARQIAGKSVIP